MADLTKEYIEKIQGSLVPRGNHCIIPAPKKLPKFPRYTPLKVVGCFLCAAEHRSIVDALILLGVGEVTIANYLNKYKLCKGKKTKVNFRNVRTHATHLKEYYEGKLSDVEEEKMEDAEMLDILLKDYRDKIKRKEELTREDKKMILDIIKTKAQLTSSKQTSLFEEVLKKINE